MSITITDKGRVALDSASSAATTMTSATITGVAAGDMLVAVTTGAIATTNESLAASDTFGGTGSWVKNEDNFPSFSGVYTVLSTVHTRILGGSPSSSGTITITRSPGSTVLLSVRTQYYLVHPSGGSIFVIQAGANGTHGTASPITVALGSIPGTSSLLIGGADEGAGTSFTQPSGWTSVDITTDGQGTVHSDAYINGSGAQSNNWTFSGTASTYTAEIVEVSETLAPNANEQHGTNLSTAANATNPVGSTTGDLIVYFVSSDATAGTAISASAGWDDLGHETITSNVHEGRVFARVLDGSGSDTFNPNGAAQDYTMIGCRIPAALHGVTTPSTDLTFAGTFNASNGNPDPPNCNPGVSQNYVWLTWGCIGATTGSTVSAGPSGYTDLVGSTSASSTTSSVARLSWKQATASSDDAGTFTSTSRPSIGITVAVPPPSSGAHNISVGIASETDSALAITHAKLKAIGIASETDSALAVGRLHSRAIGMGQETDSAPSIAFTKARAIGISTEADSALGVTTGGHNVAVTMATEADSAPVVGFTKQKALGIATEADSAPALGRGKTRAVGIPVETDSAPAVGRTKAATVGKASEADSASAVTFTKKAGIGTAVEADFALGISRAGSTPSRGHGGMIVGVGIFVPEAAPEET